MNFSHGTSSNRQPEIDVVRSHRLQFTRPETNLCITRPMIGSDVLRLFGTADGLKAWGGKHRIRWSFFNPIICFSISV